MAVKYVKFVRGSSLAFQNLISKDSDTLYFITDSDSNKSSLYLGDKLISGNITDLADLKDILVDNLSDGQLLIYDESQDKWINKSAIDAIGIMVGADSEKQGGAGLVPAPGKNQQNLFLRGDGTWATPTGLGEGGSFAPAQVFEAVALEASYEAHCAALNAKAEGIALVAGDIGIVKTAIAANVFQYTAYVYNGSAWTAMDGNYSSDSIYFDEDLTVTTPIGTITQEMINEGGGSTTLSAANKNMTQVLAGLLSKEENPIIDYPSVSYSTENKSGEVGTTFSLPSATFKVTDVGSYTYGSTDGDNKYAAEDTGVVFKAGDVTLSCGTVTKTNSADLIKGSTLSITASGDNVFTDEVIEFNFTASAKYTASANRIPVTNLGNLASDLKISTANITVDSKTAKYTGYRQSFYGSSVATMDLDSTNIRGLIGKSNSSNSTLTLDVIEGARQVVIAVPENKVVTRVEDKGAFGTNIFSEFKLIENIPVNGENNYTAKNYNVYVYAPSTALGANTYTVTVANA